VQDSFNQGFAPFYAQFVDQSSFAASWSWEFGDGQSSTGQNPAHTYVNPGSYTVSLTVQDASGTLSSTKTIPGCIIVGADPMGTGTVTTETTAVPTYSIAVTTTLPATTATPAESGIIEVRSRPSGAMVSLDGAERGITPITLYRIATGPHTVLVHLKGYPDQQAGVMVVNEQTVSLDIALQQEATTAVTSPTPAITTIPTTTETTIAAASGAAAPAYTNFVLPGSIHIYCTGCLERMYNGRQIESFQYQVYEYNLTSGKEALRHFGQVKTEDTAIGNVASGHYKVKVTPDNFKSQEQFTDVSPSRVSTVRFDGPTFVQTPGFGAILAIFAIFSIAARRKFR